MIFDRTQNDVDTSIRLISEKVQKFQELTETEIQILEKGTLTISTLNRIENKQEELKNLFNSMGYWNFSVTTREWTYLDIFKGIEFERILNNLEVLRKAFFVYKDTPNIPDNNYRKYQTINDVEKILYDLDYMVSDIKNNYKICGTFECGEE